MKFQELEFYQSNIKSPSNFKDLTGFETEYLRVIGRAPNGKHGTRWNCLCKACGEYCVKDQTNIKNHKSCGCAKKNSNIGKALRKDLSGQVFGKLTALEYSGRSNISGNAIWICRCECGTICEVDSNNLTSQHTTSCGCINYSIGVFKIKEILDMHNIAYSQEYILSDIDGMNNSHPYKMDFAIYQNNEVIRFVEYDGIQHYYDTWGSWKNEGSLSTQQIRDNRKNQYALSHNIPLVRIPYWERDKITLEMIMGDQYLVKS